LPDRCSKCGSKIDSTSNCNVKTRKRTIEIIDTQTWNERYGKFNSTFKIIVGDRQREITNQSLTLLGIGYYIFGSEDIG